MTPFELPPQSPDERDRQLALLEAREEARELDTLDADRAADKWPAQWNDGTSDDRIAWACPRCGDCGYVVRNELRCGNPGCDDTHAYDALTGERADYDEEPRRA